jgi:hypothetical protein
MSDRDDALRESGPSAVKVAAIAAVQVVLVVLICGMLRVVLEHAAWYRSFEERHDFWAFAIPTWVVIVLTTLMFQRVQRSDWEAYRHDLRRGRVKRMSFAARASALLIALALVVAGELVPSSIRAACLLLGVPLLLFFGLQELVIILRPGDFVFPNPRDELLAFFRARTLQAGYGVASLSLAALLILGLVAPHYVALVLPILLTVTVLTPSFLFNRLDRQAGADE